MRVPEAVLIIFALLTSALGQTLAIACPFCSAVSLTLSQEIAGSDVAVIARLVKLPAEPSLDDLDDPDSGMAQFEVLETLRGDNPPARGEMVKVVYFGGNEQKKRFLLKGLVGERIDWNTPIALTERGVEYIKACGSLPEKGADRVQFFMGYLEDEDPLLAQDAYDEFARAPYEVVTALADRMDRPKLIRWIEDAQVGPTRRRLYLTMLGVCGQEEDIKILESLLQYDYKQIKPGLMVMFATLGQTGPAYGAFVLSEMVKADVRRKQQCLDALIAAYLQLKGPSGLPLIEERFLANPAAEYAQVYAAVMALRFHGDDTDALPRDRLLESVRLLLDNTDIADQVILDLARWEDWSVMERLVSMFKNADKDAWVRQPVISYLIAATDQPPEISKPAEAALEELEKLDPKAVKRMRSYVAFSMLAKPKSKPPAKKSQKSVAAHVDPSEAPTASKATPDVADVADVASGGASDAASAKAAPPSGPSRMLIVGVPLIAGLLLFGIFALLLRGADLRSTNNDS